MDTALLNTLSALDARHHIHGNSNPRAVVENGAQVFSRGKGIRVVDEDGKHYIEGLAGLWCASLGFNEERLVEAAEKQMREMPYYHSFFGRAPVPTIKLAARLAEITPEGIEKIFFACSGSEAVDTAIKMIWYYNNATDRPEKKKMISRQNSYHGVTVAGASMTRIPINQEGFDLPIDRFLQVGGSHYYRYGEAGETEEAFVARRAAELEDLIQSEGPDTIAGFFAEPVQGAGGILPPAEGYFEAIQKILRKYDIFFVADEVICGFGRTGNMFGSDTYDLKPDIIIMAKGLSAGYQPISAVGVTGRIFDGIHNLGAQKGAFGHGFTYGGHPVAAAVALEAQNIYQERNIVGHVQTVCRKFQSRLSTLSDHPLVGDTRGIGLLGAVELVADKATKTRFDPSIGLGNKVFEETKRNGLLFRNAGDQLLFSPPLIISEREVKEIFDILENALNKVAETL
ncbi:aminotransferase [uncultured Roseobacter sp.]|uniref:aminotransferase n=1 Tax=uncultured Roseobacter sp. TaxID=114847 RepID=UPI00262B8E70|nr:aminotransferase [uncultured Roseobacter sp.]